MSEFLINDVALYVSKTIESAYNADVVKGQNFAMIRTLQPAYVLPQVEFVNDAGVPGNGHEFATTWCPTYITQPAFSYTDDVNFGIAGRLALRSLGGGVTTAQQFKSLGTATIAIANPGVVTRNAHGLTAGTPIRFTTTGTLPGGVTQGTTYFVLATDLSPNTFKFSTSENGAAVETTGTQTGTHTLLTSTTAYKHSCNMLSNTVSRQLPSFAIASSLGGANYRMAGMVVDRFRLSQNRADRPQYAIDVVGSGKYETPFETIGTCTISNGNPAIVTVGVALHGLAAGDQIKFSTTGTLPAGITAGQTYFVISAGLTGNDFQFSATSGGTAVVTTTDGSGTHTVKYVFPSVMDIADCLNGADVVVQWTAPSSSPTYFTGATCSLRSWFFEVANNSRLNDRCPGDPTKTITYNGFTTNPAYVNRLRRGSRTVTAQIVVLLGNTNESWERYVTGQELTNVTFKAQGNAIGTSGYKFSLNAIIPKARIQSIEPGEVDGEATLTINLLGMYDSISGGAAQVEVINTETSNYV
jgi:hypothetical protein